MSHALPEIDKLPIKRIAVILNGISLKKKIFYKNLLPPLQKSFNVEVFETRTQQDGVSLASMAVEKRFDVILAAGGDGTLNQVLNGILSNREHERNLPVLGLIPLGSGNDFARTVKVSGDMKSLISLLSGNETKLIDIGKINFVDQPDLQPRYFINIADVGMGPTVVKRVLESGRAFGSLVQYYTAIIHTFFTYKLTNIKARTPLWKWDEKIRVMAIANGKFFGNGIGIAPDATPDDGKFSCFIAGNVSVIDFILQNGRLRRGKRPIHDAIEYREMESIELRADEPMPIEADGELVGQLPVQIEIMPKRIQFLC